MKEFRAILRYAQALFLLAEKSDQLERVEKELTEAGGLVSRHPEISRLLMNATLAREEKEDFLEKVFPATFSPLLINFLKVLVQKKRFQILCFVREKFHRLYEEKRGIQRIRVKAAVSLNEEIQQRLRRALEKKLGRKVYLETTADPEILGGLILDFDGTQIDASFRSRLQELKQRLLNPC